MTPERIRELFEQHFVTHEGARITGLFSRGFVSEAVDNALKALIAEVRREVLEECEQACREVAERGPICDEPEVLARLHDNEAYACAAAIRQLAEREGER